MKIKIVGGSLSRANVGSAGFELFSQIDKDLVPREQVLIPTGIFTIFDPRFVAIIKEKSGNSLKRGLRVHAGVIDSNYRKEWGVIVSNGSNDLIEIKKDVAIAQVIFVKLSEVKFELMSQQSFDNYCKAEVNERDGGFGSTGMGIK